MRKIKCDQTRPFCERCTTTGRRCEGPAIHDFLFVHEEASTLVRRAKIVPAPTFLHFETLNLPERRAFHSYINAAAPCVSGAFDTGFWSTLVPQVSHAEPAVRNALLTIGQLFDTPLRPGPNDKDKIALEAVPANQQRAFTWYSTAVSDLKHATNRGPQSIALALLSCILFICIEFQLGNASCAVSLIRQAIALLENIADPHHNATLDTAPAAILEYVVPLFWRHAAIVATFGQPPPVDLNVELLGHNWSSIETLDEARLALYSLMYQGNGFVRVAWLSEVYPAPAPILVAGQRTLQKRVDNWLQNYQDLCARLDDLPYSTHTNADPYLLIYHSILKIWVATCTSPFQTAFDLYMSDFEDILSNAKIALDGEHNSHTAQPAPAGAELGIIPPLFFVAIKCRHPELRRRALSMLEEQPQHGLWGALSTVEAVRKAIELEEDGLDKGPMGPQKVCRLRLPEEAKRVHNFDVLVSTASSPRPDSIRVWRVIRDANGRRCLRAKTVAL